MKSCNFCNKTLIARYSKYCSIQCQFDYQYKKYIEEWKNGINSGERGINTKNLSRHVIRYLHEKSDGKCSSCGWDKVNLTTNRVPLEIDHIDGDSNNNTESNLRLICPNCHSLTSNFRNLNNGNGRSWRKLKYNKSDT